MFACHISPEEQRTSAGNAMITTTVEMETPGAEPAGMEVAQAGVGTVGKLTIGAILLGIGMRMFKPKRR